MARLTPSRLALTLLSILMGAYGLDWLPGLGTDVANISSLAGPVDEKPSAWSFLDTPPSFVNGNLTRMPSSYAAGTCEVDDMFNNKERKEITDCNCNRVSESKRMLDRFKQLPFGTPKLRLNWEAQRAVALKKCSDFQDPAAPEAATAAAEAWSFLITDGGECCNSSYPPFGTSIHKTHHYWPLRLAIGIWAVVLFSPLYFGKSLRAPNLIFTRHSPAFQQQHDAEVPIDMQDTAPVTYPDVDAYPRNTPGLKEEFRGIWRASFLFFHPQQQEYMVLNVLDEQHGQTAKSLARAFSWLIIVFIMAQTAPLLVETWIQSGWMSAWGRIVKQMLTFASKHFIFQATVIGIYVTNEIRYGGASYLPIGRGLPTERPHLLTFAETKKGGYAFDFTSDEQRDYEENMSAWKSRSNSNNGLPGERLKAPLKKVGEWAGIYTDWAQLAFYDGTRLLVALVLVLRYNGWRPEVGMASVWWVISLGMTIMSWLFGPFFFNPIQFTRHYWQYRHNWSKKIFDERGNRWRLWNKKTQMKPGTGLLRVSVLDVVVAEFVIGCWYTFVNTKVKMLCYVVEVTELRITPLLPPVVSSMAMVFIIRLLRSCQAHCQPSAITYAVAVSMCVVLESVAPLWWLVVLERKNAFFVGILLKYTMLSYALLGFENLLRFKYQEELQRKEEEEWQQSFGPAWDRMDPQEQEGHREECRIKYGRELQGEEEKQWQQSFGLAWDRMDPQKQEEKRNEWRNGKIANHVVVLDFLEKWIQGHGMAFDLLVSFVLLFMCLPFALYHQVSRSCSNYSIHNLIIYRYDYERDIVDRSAPVNQPQVQAQLPDHLPVTMLDDLYSDTVGTLSRAEGFKCFEEALERLMQGQADNMLKDKQGCKMEEHTRKNEKEVGDKTAEKQKATPSQIFVRGFGGGTIVLNVDVMNTTHFVKLMLQDRLQIPQQFQRLTFSGKELQDHQTLSGYGVRKQSTLGLVGRLRGGMPIGGPTGGPPPTGDPKGGNPGMSGFAQAPVTRAASVSGNLPNPTTCGNPTLAIASVSSDGPTGGVPTKVAVDTLLADLQKLNLRDLKKRARDGGVAAKTVEDADDNVEPRRVLIDVILQMEANKPEGVKYSTRGAAEERARLMPMTLKELKKIAIELGFDTAAADADDREDPKGFLVETILSKKEAGGTTATLQITRAQLEVKNLKELKKQAKDMGIGFEDVENCDDKQNPKEAAMELILTKQAGSNIASAGTEIVDQCGTVIASSVVDPKARQGTGISRVNTEMHTSQLKNSPAHAAAAKVDPPLKSVAEAAKRDPTRQGMENAILKRGCTMVPDLSCLFQAINNYPKGEAYFFQNLLPFICDEALLYEQLFPIGLPIVDHESPRELRTLPLSQRQCLCISCNAFLCAWQRRTSDNCSCREKPDLPSINLDEMMRKEGNPGPQTAKCQMFLHYVDKQRSRLLQGDQLDRVITFIRSKVEEEETPRWASSTTPLCPIEVFPLKEGIDTAYDALRADFANRYVGGGSIAYGCVQEEIMFACHPELNCARLFFPYMRENESFILCGFEKFVNTEGYAFQLRCGTAYDDPTIIEKLPNGRAMKSCVTAIDAVDFRSQPAQEQYKQRFVNRDLLKAFAGFAVDPVVNAPKILATGNWGSGAFLGNPHFKCLIQWAAASEAGHEKVKYFPFDNQPILEQLPGIQKKLINRGTTVGDLCEWLLNGKFDPAKPILDQVETLQPSSKTQPK